MDVSSEDGYTAQCRFERKNLHLSTPPDMVVFYSLTEDNNGLGGPCFGTNFGELYFNFQNTDPLTCYTLIDKYYDCFTVKPPEIRDIFGDPSAFYEGSPTVTMELHRKPSLIKSATKL